jgi:hypothetical protein
VNPALSLKHSSVKTPKSSLNSFKWIAAIQFMASRGLSMTDALKPLKSINSSTYPFIKNSSRLGTAVVRREADRLRGKLNQE